MTTPADLEEEREWDRRHWEIAKLGAGELGELASNPEARAAFCKRHAFKWTDEDDVRRGVVDELAFRNVAPLDPLAVAVFGPKLFGGGDDE